MAATTHALEGWRPFIKGETALDFGAKYLFANPETRELGLYYSHQAPDTATVCIKAAAILDAARVALNTREG